MGSFPWVIKLPELEVVWFPFWNDGPPKPVCTMVLPGLFSTTASPGVFSTMVLPGLFTRWPSQAFVQLLMHSMWPFWLRLSRPPTPWLWIDG